MIISPVYEPDECAICLEPMLQEFKTECCKQIIHKVCYDKCNRICPFCRKNNNPVDLFQRINGRRWVCFCGLILVVFIITSFAYHYYTNN
jgi:hypothetical protein